MSGYTLGNYNFIRWEGPRPQLVKQHVRTFTKPGSNAITAQLLGVHGEEFAVRLTSVYATEPEVLIAENHYRLLVGQVLSLWYEGASYDLLHSTRYLVNSVMGMEAKRHPLLIGLGYHFPGGWRVVTDFRLTPVYVGA